MLTVFRRAGPAAGVSHRTARAPPRCGKRWPASSVTAMTYPLCSTCGSSRTSRGVASAAHTPGEDLPQSRGRRLLVGDEILQGRVSFVVAQIRPADAVAKAAPETVGLQEHQLYPAPIVGLIPVDRRVGCFTRWVGRDAVGAVKVGCGDVGCDCPHALREKGTVDNGRMLKILR